MKQFLLKIFKSSFTIISIVTVISFWSVASYFIINTGGELLSSEENIETTATTTEATVDSDNCNVYGLNLHGTIVTYHSRDSYNDNDKLAVDETSADEAYWIIKDAEKNEKIKFIVAEIDSAGGSPAAGMEIMSAFKNSKKPVIVFARSGAMSAAYLAATGAQTIFASSVSDIGSIGVTASYLENTAKNKKDGLKYVDLSAGKYKDTLSPDRPLTNEEKQIVMRDINLLHEYFIKAVAENRKLDISKVRKLADGSTMLGEAALKNGLIDKIGNIYDVENFLKERLGEEAKICWQN